MVEKTKAYMIPTTELGNRTYRKVIVWYIVDGQCKMAETFSPDKNRSKNERKEIILEHLRSHGFLIEDL